MAAKVALASSLSSKVSVLPNSWSQNPLTHYSLSFPLKLRAHYQFKAHANLGGRDGQLKPKAKGSLLEERKSQTNFGKQQEKGKGRIP